MWHTDYKHLNDGRWFICYLDDVSRYITEHGIFDDAVGNNTIKILKDVVKNHGTPASILTDHGVQFYANEVENKRHGATEFEKKLVEMNIKHLLARVNHLQTNGKLEQFHGEIQQKCDKSIDELVYW